MSEYKCFVLHNVLIVVMNVLVLVALFVAMYRASLTPEDFNLTFFKTFAAQGLILLALGLGGKFLLNRCRQSDTTGPSGPSAP